MAEISSVSSSNVHGYAGAVLAPLADAMIVIDPIRGRVIHASSTTRQVLALGTAVEPDSAADELWTRVSNPDAERIRAALSSLSTDGSALTIGVTAENCELRSVRLRLYPNGARPRELFILAEDITEALALEQRQRNEELEQRDALIREIHHRIKNNLQGVAGLLEQAANRQPTIRRALDGVATQIRSIATVHGMQGASGNVLEVVSLAQEIAESVFRRFGCPITVSADSRPGDQRWGIVEHDAVSVALTLNELLTNASKHRQDVVPVQLHVCQKGMTVVLRISNRGELPKGFDFLSGNGLPGGLRLIKALLPRSSCQLQISAAEGLVVAELRLAAPTLARIE